MMKTIFSAVSNSWCPIVNTAMATSLDYIIAVLSRHGIHCSRTASLLTLMLVIAKRGRQIQSGDNEEHILSKRLATPLADMTIWRKKASPKRSGSQTHVCHLWYGMLVVGSIMHAQPLFHKHLSDCMVQGLLSLAIRCGASPKWPSKMQSILS